MPLKNPVTPSGIDPGPSITMVKAAFHEKKTLFTIELDLNLREKCIKCHINAAGGRTPVGLIL
jgi:hypothetical protein